MQSEYHSSGFCAVAVCGGGVGCVKKSKMNHCNESLHQRYQLKINQYFWRLIQNCKTQDPDYLCVSVLSYTPSKNCSPLNWTQCWCIWIETLCFIHYVLELVHVYQSGEAPSVKQLKRLSWLNDEFSSFFWFNIHVLINIHCNLNNVCRFLT